MSVKGWFPKVDYIWMNGELVAWDDAKIHVLSHGNLYGTGVFEGIRCYETDKGSAIFRLKAHVDRLVASTKILRMDNFSMTADELGQAIKDTVKANKLTKCYIRPVIEYGYYSLGVLPANECPIYTSITAFDWDKAIGGGKKAHEMDEDSHDKGVRLGISSWTRVHSRMIPSAAKACGTYINNMLAKVDAGKAGFDEAIMFDETGYVAEGGIENIFIVKDNKIFTPGLENSVLPGITRDSVIKIARDAGYDMIEKSLAIGEVLTADEIFLTGTATEITPVREINHTILGDGKPGKVSTDIQERFKKIVKGQDDRYSDWLDFIED